MIRPISLAFYTATHFLCDLACAFFAFSAMNGAGGGILFLILYNFFAFAMQMPLGLLADRLNRNSLFAAVGLALVAVCALFSRYPLAMAVVAGLGNGMFHVGGGLDVLNASERRSGKLGIFVSSGAPGLFLGGLIGTAGRVPAGLISLELVVAAAGVLLLCGNIRSGCVSQNALPEPRRIPAGQMVSLALLFVVVALRSYLGITAGFDWQRGGWAWMAVFAVALGKALGGFAADRLGLRLASTLSLGGAAVLFLFSDSAIFGVLALFLFNMTMPITLFATARILRTMKGFSFGLLTFALFLGLLPTFLKAPAPLNTPLGLAAVTLISLALMAAGLRGRAQDELLY